MEIENVSLLLGKIKSALINLGYATKNTPDIFIQDVYLKYIIIKQTGQNPNVPYGLSLLPKALQDALEGTIPPTETNPPIEFDESEWSGTDIVLTMYMLGTEPFYHLAIDSDILGSTATAFEFYVDGKPVTVIKSYDLFIVLFDEGTDYRIVITDSQGTHKFRLTADNLNIVEQDIPTYPSNISTVTTVDDPMQLTVSESDGDISALLMQHFDSTRRGVVSLGTFNSLVDLTTASVRAFYTEDEIEIYEHPEYVTYTNLQQHPVGILIYYTERSEYLLMLMLAAAPPLARTFSSEGTGDTGDTPHILVLPRNPS